MAVKPLESRLDKLVQQTDQLEQNVETAQTQPLEPLPDTAAVVSEGIQVAGPMTAIREMLRKGTKGIARKETPPLAPAPPPVSPEVQTISAAEDAAKTAPSLGLSDQPTARVATKIEASKRISPQLTPEAVTQGRAKAQAELAVTPLEEQKPPIMQFNLPMMDTQDSVKATVESINELLDIKPKTITFDEVRDSAVKAGMDMGFINQLTSGKLNVNPENTYRALNAMTASAVKLDGYAAKVANGTATDIEKAEMAQWIHFHSVLQESVKGYQTNVAQSLSVMRIPRTGGTDMSVIMESIGTETDLVKFAQAYLDAGTPEGKAKLISKMATGTPWEKAFTVYVNSLLYGTGTMVKNALSSAIFTPYRMAERGVASGIGAARAAVNLGSDADRYRIQELPAMLVATPQAMADGWGLLKHAFAKGYPKDWIDPDKIARSQQRLELFKRGDPRFWNPEGSLADAALWGMNAAITLPGRTILATDQFFKGVNYRYELVAEQTRAGIVAREEALAAGKTAQEAQDAAIAASDNIALNPPEYLSELAAASTFSQKVEGKLGEVMANLGPSDPARFALRTQLPFISAPVNVMSSVLERTPMAAFTKNFWAKQGTKEGDLALAKVGLASGAMMTMSHAATMGAVTGSGPGDKGQREAMMRQGWQPYSIVLAGDSADAEVRQALSKFPGMVKYGSGEYEGKVFLSYQGLEPIGALLAISADYTDYVRYEDDDSRINAYVGGAAFGLANYIMEHPFLTGVGNISALIGSGIPNGRQQVIQTINYLTETATTVGLQIANPFTRPTRFAEQLGDPMQRDYQMNPNAPAGLKGLLDALNKYKANTPGLSEGLPPKLNIWSEPVSHEYAWSPFRAKEGQARKADQGLIQLNANVSMPGREVSAMDPISQVNGKTKLEAGEYNELLRIANKELELEKRVELVLDAIGESMLTDRQDLVFYQNEVSKVFSSTFEAARKLLIERSPEIKQRIAENAARVKEFGKGAK